MKPIQIGDVVLLRDRLACGTVLNAWSLHGRRYCYVEPFYYAHEATHPGPLTLNASKVMHLTPALLKVLQKAHG